MGIVNYLYSGTAFSEFLRGVLVKFGFQLWHNKRSMKKLRKNPIASMLDAREFFNANQRRVENVKNLLADEKSKDTFMKLIHQRQFYEEKDIPDYDHFNQYFPDDINGFTPPPYSMMRDWKPVVRCLWIAVHLMDIQLICL